MVCMFVCTFAVFAFFWPVLEELGMHGGLHVCMHIYDVCALLAFPASASDAQPTACLYAYVLCLHSFGLSWKSSECIVYCMFVYIFTLFAVFWLVHEVLGLHSGLNVCMYVLGVRAVVASSGRAWNA